MKLVEVDWIDSSSQWGWKNLDKLRGDCKSRSLLCRTVGYLIADEDDRIALVQSLAWVDEKIPPTSGDSMMTIPRMAIVKIRKLSGGIKQK